MKSQVQASIWLQQNQLGVCNYDVIEVLGFGDQGFTQVKLPLKLGELREEDDATWESVHSFDYDRTR